MLPQAFTARGWACFVLFGGHYVIPALASSASMQGARVGSVLVNWMCSPKSREHPRGAPRSLLTQVDVAHVYGTTGDLPSAEAGLLLPGH